MNIDSTFSVHCRRTGSIAFAGNARLLIFLFSVICSLCVSVTGLAQTQLGTDINGESVDDRFGYSTSLSSDGYRLAVGAYRNDSNGTDSGHVRVYQWSDSAWIQLGIDIDGEAAGDSFGRSVSLSSDGNRMAIGASNNDGSGDRSGHVRVYQWSGSAWTQLGADIDGEAALDLSGWAVSLSSEGDRLAIGSEWNDGDNGVDSGHVRVYQWSGSVWTLLGADIDGEAGNDRSGYSVSMSADGNHLAIGAWNNTGNGDSSGHTRVYQWSGTAWTQMGADIDGEAAGDNSGYSVSLSADGGRLAIGAPDNGDSVTTSLQVSAYHVKSGHVLANPDDSGHVRVYQWSDAAWTQLGEDIDGEAADDGSGGRVSISSDGNRLAIGAPYNDGNGSNSGHTRVYQWSGTAWTQIGVDINGEAVDDRSGRGVTLSSDGNLLAIGASRNDGSGDNSGHVRVYDLSMFNVFRINPGLNDAWYDPDTGGQGFFITVFPDLGYVSLAWFTYDTVLPPEDAIANLGDAGHRWLTALGPITEDHVVMNITMTSGGIFDTPTEIQLTDPPGSDGTIILTFDNCNSGTIEYDIPSINRQGIVPIRRVADDNIVICEALNTN